MPSDIQVTNVDHKHGRPNIVSSQSIENTFLKTVKNVSLFCLANIFTTAVFVTISSHLLGGSVFSFISYPDELPLFIISAIFSTSISGLLAITAVKIVNLVLTRYGYNKINPLAEKAIIGTGMLIGGLGFPMFMLANMSIQIL